MRPSDSGLTDVYGPPSDIGAYLKSLTCGHWRSAAFPRPLRRKRWMRNLPPYQRWLRDDALAEMTERLADDQADDPLRWDSYQSVSRRRRSMDLTLQTLQSLCALEGASYVAPFLNEGFLASLAAWGGKLGRGNRTEVMTELFSSVLPSRVLERISKASFGGVFWGPESRRFHSRLEWQRGQYGFDRRYGVA